MFFFLIAGHALMDFALQSDAMASCKCRKSTNPLARVIPWYYWLGAHVILHGAAVGWVIHWFVQDFRTALVYAVAETVVHWFIDVGKCEGLYNIHVDQALHVGCKGLWCVLLVQFGMTGEWWARYVPLLGAG